MSDYDRTKQEINSLVQSIITSVTTLQDNFAQSQQSQDGYEFLNTKLDEILLHTKIINEEILPNISNTEKLHNLRDKLNEIRNVVVPLIDRYNYNYERTNSINFLTIKQSMQGVLEIIENINNKISYLENILAVSVDIQVQEQPPTSTQVDTSKFKAIGLSTREGSYKKGEPSWMNIYFKDILDLKLNQLLGIKDWEQCQFIIGFEIPKEATTSDGLMYLEPSNILLRLDKLATDNIVAISELIRSGKKWM